MPNHRYLSIHNDREQLPLSCQLYPAELWLHERDLTGLNGLVPILCLSVPLYLSLSFTLSICHSALLLLYHSVSNLCLCS